MNSPGRVGDREAGVAGFGQRLLDRANGRPAPFGGHRHRLDVAQRNGDVGDDAVADLQGPRQPVVLLGIQ